VLVKVPYINLGLQSELMLHELLPAMEAVLKQGDFILGREVETFEAAFAARCGSQFAVGVNSGTDALILAMRSLGIGPGDEVMTVPNSFLATTSSIALVGATPVFVDVGPDQNIAPSLIEDRITPKSEAIIPVHLTGRPAKMDAVMEIARSNNLVVIEDCAQAVGAKYGGKHVGTFGTVGCFSLHPLKNLGSCGDGGVIITDDEELYYRLRIARNHGLKNRDECLHWSLNSRLDTLQAAILNVKLHRLDRWTKRRRQIAQFYFEHLDDLPVRLPYEDPDEYCVYHAFVVQTERRDELQDFLSQNGIEAKVHYPIPVHLQESAKYLGGRPGDFPVAERQSREILSLPVFPELTDEQVGYVVKTIRRFFDPGEET